MGKHLYFVCPTDNLETVIENHFQNKNYFLSSLGNSLGFSFEVVEEINSLIENKGITEINFVLAIVQLYCFIVHCFLEKFRNHPVRKISRTIHTTGSHNNII